MKNEKGGTEKEREQRKPGEKRKRGNKGKRGTWLTRRNAGTRITRGIGKKKETQKHRGTKTTRQKQE